MEMTNEQNSHSVTQEKIEAVWDLSAYGGVDGIFVETALGKRLESGEKGYTSQRKTAPACW